MFHATRNIIASLFEGDYCESMSASIGVDFARGEEFSTFDAGIPLNADLRAEMPERPNHSLLGPRRQSTPMVALDIKTVMVYRRRNGSWFGKFKLQDGQRQCDFFCLMFPCLRNAQKWSVFHQWQEDGRNEFTCSVNGMRLENVVPPYLWREVVGHDNLGKMLLAVRATYQASQVSVQHKKDARTSNLTLEESQQDSEHRL